MCSSAGAAQFVATARTATPFCLVLHQMWRVPFLLHSPPLTELSRHPVSGEVYEVDDAILAHLDEFEQVSTSFYRREAVEVFLGEAGHSARPRVGGVGDEGDEGDEGDARRTRTAWAYFHCQRYDESEMVACSSDTWTVLPGGCYTLDAAAGYVPSAQRGLA